MSDSGQSASSTAASDEVDQELYDALQARLLRSGDWVRLQTALRLKLSEAGYTDDLFDFTRERLRSDPALRFPGLMDAVREYGLRECFCMLCARRGRG